MDNIKYQIVSLAVGWAAGMVSSL